MADITGFLTYRQKCITVAILLLVNTLIVFKWSWFGFMDWHFGFVTVPIIIGVIDVIMAIMAYNGNLT